MGSIIKRPFRTFNGVDWDTHYFDTSEDMIKSGWTQSQAEFSAYRKLPGGFILQFGKTQSVVVPSAGYITPDITYPIAFPNKVCSVQLTLYNTNWRGRVQHRDGSSNAKAAVVVNEVNAGEYVQVQWFALGY